MQNHSSPLKYLQDFSENYHYVEDMDIDLLEGADYNPRLLTDDKKEKLIKSIKEIGFLFPVICCKRNLDDEKYILLAGHQRTKALKAMGINKVPCIIIRTRLNHFKERLINQYHNEIENHDFDCKIKLEFDCDLVDGIQMIPNNRVKILSYEQPNTLSVRLNQLIELMLGIGNFNTTIIGKNHDGQFEVLFGQEYILACNAIGFNYRVSYISNPDITDKARVYLVDKYGKNNFADFMGKNVYIQSNAQPQRGVKHESHSFSQFYSTFSDDDLQDKRFLDLFSGKGVESDKIKKKKKGILKDMNRIELFHCAKRFNLSLKITRFFIQQTINSIDKDLLSGGNGLFDFVICDSVINSVDSLQAEKDVINCCISFLKPNGYLIMSGRLYEQITNNYTARSAQKLFPLDDEGFSFGDYHGKWFCQRFHRDKEHFLEVIYKNTNQLSEVAWDDKSGHFSMIFKRTKTNFTPAMQESIKREFDLPHGDVSIGYGNKMLETLKKCYKNLK